MLICEGHKFFLTKECPEELAATVVKSIRDKYDAWI